MPEGEGFVFGEMPDDMPDEIKGMILGPDGEINESAVRGLVISAMAAKTIGALAQAHASLAAARLEEVMASTGDDDEKFQARVSTAMAERDLAAALDRFEGLLNSFQKTADQIIKAEGDADA